MQPLRHVHRAVNDLREQARVSVCQRPIALALPASRGQIMPQRIYKVCRRAEKSHLSPWLESLARVTASRWGLG